MDDKRKIKRRHLIYYLRIFDLVTEQLVGHLIDITTEGIMVMSEQPFENDKAFKFRMALPTDIFKERYIEFEVISKWCRHDVDPAFYNTGFYLVNPTDKDNLIIKRLISDFGFHD